LFAPGLEQILESLADDGLALAAADLLDVVELLQVVVDEKLADACSAAWFFTASRPAPRSGIRMRALME
jgi:hypothetical protein